MRYAGEKKLNIWVATTLGILTLFLLFVVYPLVLVFYKSVLFEGGNLSFAYFTKFFARKYYWSTLINNFKITIISTIVATVLGLVVAYVLRSVQIKGSKYLNILIVVSYLSPPFIGAYAWIQLLGRNGFFTKTLNSLFHIKLGGIYGFAGIILVLSLQSFPLVHIYISGTLKNLDNSLNEAVESPGRTTFQRVMRIIVPLVMPTMLVSSLLVFIRVFSNFGIPVLIGEGYKTFPVLIYSQLMGGVGAGDHFTVVLCVAVIGITLVLFFLRRYPGDRLTYSMTALKPMVAEKYTDTRDILSHLFMYTMALIAILLQITVIVTSSLATGGETVCTGGFSLKSYGGALFPKDNSTVIFNTYLFGMYVIAIVVVFGILVPYLTVRKKSFLTGILDTVTMLPYIIPSSIPGISFLYAFNNEPLLLSGTAIIIIVSLSIRRMPYTIHPSTTIIGRTSPSVEEAAISLGCTKTKSSVKVAVPMMIFGVPSGAIMSWITLTSELDSSIILYTSKTQTLTVAIYAEVIRSNFGGTAAYSTILTLTSIPSLLVFFKITGSNGISI